MKEIERKNTVGKIKRVARSVFRILLAVALFIELLFALGNPVNFIGILILAPFAYGIFVEKRWGHIGYGIIKIIEAVIVSLRVAFSSGAYEALSSYALVFVDLMLGIFAIAIAPSDDEFLQELTIDKTQEVQRLEKVDENLRELQELEGESAVQFAMELPDGWVCVCGTKNTKDALNCTNCHRNRDYVLEKWVRIDYHDKLSSDRKSPENKVVKNHDEKGEEVEEEETSRFEKELVPHLNEKRKQDKAQDSVLTCPNCGAEVLPDYKYCINCGAKLGTENNVPKHADQKSNAKSEILKILFASDKEIIERSHGEVTKGEIFSYRTNSPEPGGLFCERIFGPVHSYQCHCGKLKGIQYKRLVCSTCGVEILPSSVRRERFGHIELASPVVHIWYFKNNINCVSLLLDMPSKDIEKVIYFDSYVVIDPKRTKLRYKQILSDDEYRTYKSEGFDFIAKKGGEAIKDLLERVDLSKLKEQALEKLKSGVKQDKIIAVRLLSVVEGLLANNRKLGDMVLTVVPVIPPDLRPLVPLEGGKYASDDLNELYGRVINRNIKLKKLREDNAPDIMLEIDKRKLQEAVDSLFEKMLFDNGLRPYPVMSSTKKEKKTINLNSSQKPGIPFPKGDKFGFIDKDGNFVIEPKYDAVRPFFEGLAAVCIDDKWGYIDKKGNFVIVPEYEQAHSFSEGLAAVCIDDKWGYIDKKRNFIIQPKYDNARPFFEGLAPVELDDEWGYIDKKGRFVIPTMYDNARPFFEGLALVEIDGKWGFIDEEGEEIIPPEYDEADIFSENLVPFKLNGKLGFIDKESTQYWED